MKNKGIIKNQAGLTLVELIISIGIFGLIMVVAVQFMSVSSRIYQKSNTEITVQNEVQTLTNHLQNLIAATNTNMSVDGDRIYLIDSDDFEVIEYDSSNDYVLYYSLDELTSDTDVIDEYKGLTDREAKLNKAKQIVANSTLSSSDISSYLLAEYVSEFTVTPHITDNYVTVHITMERNEVTYSAAKNIYLRNKMYDNSTTASADSTTAADDSTTAAAGD